MLPLPDRIAGLTPVVAGIVHHDFNHPGNEIGEKSLMLCFLILLAANGQTQFCFHLVERTSQIWSRVIDEPFDSLGK